MLNHSVWYFPRGSAKAHQGPPPWPPGQRPSAWPRTRACGRGPRGGTCSPCNSPTDGYAGEGTKPLRKLVEVRSPRESWRVDIGSSSMFQLTSPSWPHHRRLLFIYRIRASHPFLWGIDYSPCISQKRHVSKLYVHIYVFTHVQLVVVVWPPVRTDIILTEEIQRFPF